MLFNHDEIYNKIKDKYQERGYDTEFGSNIQQIQNSMQYLISHLNQNTQINIKETVLSSQTKRNMILENQRMLGYEAIQKRSYIYKVTIEIENLTSNEETFRLSNFQEFKSGQNTFLFIDSLNSQNSVVIPQKEKQEMTVIVKEGSVKKHTENDGLVNELQMIILGDESVRTEYFVDIPFKDVEEDGIFIQAEYEEDGNIKREIWEKSSNYILENNNEKVFIRQDNIGTSMPRVYLNYQGRGVELIPKTLIKADVIVTKGTEGKADDEFNLEDYDTDLFKVEFIESSILSNGTNEETNESIKKNQPLFNSTQNRQVTVHDFEQIQGRQPIVKHQFIWDSFDEYDKKAGRIWFSFVPNSQVREYSDTSGGGSLGTRWLLQDYKNPQNLYINDEDWHEPLGASEVNTIFNHMRKYTIPSMEFIFRQPVYLDFYIDIRVQQYNSQQSTTEANKEIFDQVNEYFKYDSPEDERAIESFKSRYFNSDLTDYIIQNVVDGIKFDISIKNKVYLTERNINKIEQDKEFVSFKMGVQFVPIIDGGMLLQNGLPNIRTPNFLDGKELMSSSIFLSDTTTNENGVLYQDITLGNDKIGLYRVYAYRKVVEVIIDDEYVLSQLHKGLGINVQYPTPNIQMQGNTIPRLIEVNMS